MMETRFLLDPTVRLSSVLVVVVIICIAVSMHVRVFGVDMLSIFFLLRHPKARSFIVFPTPSVEA